MTYPDLSTTPGPAPADDRRAVTGKRRIAFAVHVAGCRMNCPDSGPSCAASR